MKYLGGKFKLKKKIASILESVRKPYHDYIEPFCGACNVISEMSGQRFAYDIHPELIAMWKAVQNGFTGPDIVTEEDYKKAKDGLLSPEETAFILFGCSFGGKWKGGYARSKRRENYAGECKRSLINIAPKLKDVYFSCEAYDFIDKDYKIYNDCLIYCDPPYAGVTQYKNKFDSAKFWEWVRIYSYSNTIIVSEFKAPVDFECIAEFPQKLSVRSKTGCDVKIEKLFKYKG